MARLARIFLAGILMGVCVLPAAWAASMRCPRFYIEGLEIEHAKGLAILGPATVTDPQKMSVYVTLGRYSGKKALFVQSNYKEHPDEFPIKIAVSDDVDLNRVLSWIPVRGKNVKVEAK